LSFFFAISAAFDFGYSSGRDQAGRGVLGVFQGEEGKPLLVHRVGSLVPARIFVDDVLEGEDRVFIILLGVERLALPVERVRDQLVNPGISPRNR